MGRCEELLAEGERLLRADDALGAQAAFATAVREAEREFGAGARQLILPLWWLAKAHRAHHYTPCDELKQAVAIGEECVRLAEANAVSDEELSSILDFHATSLWLDGQHRDALGVVRRAVAVTRRTSSDVRPHMAMSTEILLDLGELSEALVDAQQLIEQDRTFTGEPTAHSLFLLANCLRQIAGRETEAREVITDILTRYSDTPMADVVRTWLPEQASS